MFSPRQDNKTLEMFVCTNYISCALHIQEVKNLVTASVIVQESFIDGGEK